MPRPGTFATVPYRSGFFKKNTYKQTIFFSPDYSAAGSAAGSGKSHSPHGHPHHPHPHHRDSCLGRVCVGASVRGERERAHWRQVVQHPREVATR